jgi:hypothetical protein
LSGRRNQGNRAVPIFEEAFGVPAGHVLRQVRPTPEARVSLGLGWWEHEEYDRAGDLVAIYESWLPAGGGLTFVKYSPYGWVLSVSGRSPRLSPARVRVQPAKAA